MNQEYIVYNTHLNLELNINDAVKITTIPQNESFWVAITKLNNNNTFEAQIQNILFRKHNFNYKDIITLEYKNIKEYKQKENRFNINSIDKHTLLINYQLFKNIYNREPTLEDIDNFINIRLNKNIN